MPDPIPLDYQRPLPNKRFRWGWLVLVLFPMLMALLASVAFFVLPVPQSGIKSVSSATPRGMRAMTPEDFAALIGKPDHVLLDVRTPEEHAAGHIAKTDQLIDFESPDFAEKLAELPRGKTYLIYCRSGRRSGIAAKQMLDLGFSTVVDLQGGILAWQKAGHPVEKGK